MEDRYEMAYKTALTQASFNQNYHSADLKQAYNDLQYKYFALQQQHERLKTQFNYLCDEASNRIAKLDDDAESILRQKNDQIQALYAQIKGLKGQNYQILLEKDKIQRQTSMLHAELGDLERDIRDQSYDQEKSLKSLQMTKQRLQIDLQQKKAEILVLKSALSNQQHKYIQKDQANKNLDRQLNLVVSQNQQLQRILKQKLAIQADAKDLNYLLKRQVQELKDLIQKSQSGLSHCQSCFVLKSDNQRIQQQMESLAVQCLQSRRQAQRRTKNLISEFQQSQCQNRWLKKELDTMKGGIDRLRYQMDYRDKENIPRSSMKESIIERCKNIIDSGYNRL